MNEWSEQLRAQRIELLRRPVFSWLVVLCIAALPAAAQPFPDGTCAVSILNQTAWVQADGSWSLPNVPANMGAVRARVNCVDDAGTASGASDSYGVERRRMSAILEVGLGGAAPVPEHLVATAPTSDLAGAGATAQLAVSASFADGTARDVTASAAGTTYGSSNNRIATVSPEGLVTAWASGRVLVTALNEAVLSAVLFHVVTSVDSDGDGIPDDLELASGLDPNNPIDALADLDGDGLTNRQELADFGTDLARADTDGDGLGDGREVGVVGTEPLLFDTDGDGFGDGLEVQTGSNPLDPASFNLSAALASLTVEPDRAVIVYNTVLGEASRQLTVRGRLIDGTELDITSRRFGTSYVSSDLSVLSFGPEDGRVYAGQGGFATVTVAAGGRSTTATLNVQRFQPQAFAELALSGFPNAVAVTGDLAVVAAGAVGLHVIDVSDPATPRAVARLDTAGNANDVQVEGDLAYVADGRAGVAIVDVSTPETPRLLGTVVVPGTATDLAVREGLVYVAAEEAFAVVDARDPAAPLLRGTVSTLGRARSVALRGSIALVAEDTAGVSAVDVSDPDNPVVLGRTSLRPNGRSGAWAIAASESFAIVGEGRSSASLKRLDLTEPAAPAVAGGTNELFQIADLVLDGSLGIAADVISPVLFVGVEDIPLSFRAALYGRSGLEQATGIAVRDGLVFTTTAFDVRPEDNGVAGGGTLRVARYAVYRDQDAMAPTVRLTAPEVGARVIERRTLALTADASDDIAVSAVEFLVDGVVVATDFERPYRASLEGPEGRTSIAVAARAIDWGGNVQVTPPVTVRVTPDTSPTASFTAPRMGTLVPVDSEIPLVVRATDDFGVVGVELFADGVLLADDTQPPFVVTWTAPATAGPVTLTAVARDALGQVGSSPPVTVQVSADTPPLVEIRTPVNGSTAVAGGLVRFEVSATDDASVPRVTFLRNDQPVGTDASPPYVITLLAPVSASSLELRATARDDLGQVTSSELVTVTLAADPGTAIQGRAVDSVGLPLAGATVTALSERSGTFEVQSGADGGFLLEDLPTAEGTFELRARLLSGTLEFGGGIFDPLPPLPGAVVEVGDVVLLPAVPVTRVVGRVEDEAGDPVADAAVSVHNGLEASTATTTTSGAFSVPNVPVEGMDGSPLVLAVSAEATVAGERLRGRLPAPIGGTAGGITEVGVITLTPYDPALDPRTEVVGVVMNFVGDGLPGTEVRISTPFALYATTSDFDGAFSIPNVAALDGDLAVRLVFVENDGSVVAGDMGSFTPVLGGITDLGTLFLAANGGEQ